MEYLRNFFNGAAATLLAVGVASALNPAFAGGGESRLSDQPIPINKTIVERTPPLIELGQSFLDTGNIDPGFTLPTGAVWQPQLLVWGDLRSAVQTFDNGITQSTEWANRLNLFTQLRVTGTERLLVSFRPLDRDGRFSGYRWKPDAQEGSVNGINAEISTAFIEGEFGEIFPNLDPDDSRGLDIGFSLGRQPIFYQDGMLINDRVDSVGIVKNSIRISGASNTRVAGLFAWDQVNRHDNAEDNSAKLFAILTETDIPCCTISLDGAYVDADNTTGDGWYLGLSSVQRIGPVATTFRYLHSEALDGETPQVGTGSLWFADASYSPVGTHDNLYATGFWGMERFTSASRDIDVGGPLGRAGILFAAVGLGNYGAALGNQATESAGGALGYQHFMDGTRRQLIVELGYRGDTDQTRNSEAVAVGARLQQAFGRHTIGLLEGFVGDHETNGETFGLRAEMRYKF